MNFLNFRLPPIYPITDVAISGLTHLDQVRELIAGGARLIQLREKSAAPRDFYAAACEVISFARPAGVKILINDRVDIALAAGADGVHIGQDDLPPPAAREILGSDAIVGFSTHSIEQAAAAVHMKIDYIAVGPIFETTSKSAPDPVVGLANLRRAREAVGSFPLVAIGGVRSDNLRAVLAAGADSAAVLSDIVSDPAAIREKMRHLSELANNVVVD